MTESREYHIRVQLVNGGLEQLHSGMEELCTFTVAVEADSEEQALAKADGAIFHWAHKHNFYEGQWICNHADRFKGAVPFTLENFFKETGGNLHEKARDARIEAHGTANYLNWRTGLPWDLEPHADDTPEEAANRAAQAERWKTTMASSMRRIDQLRDAGKSPDEINAVIAAENEKGER
jgi:hypothetical protein